MDGSQTKRTSNQKQKNTGHNEKSKKQAQQPDLRQPVMHIVSFFRPVFLTLIENSNQKVGNRTRERAKRAKKTEHDERSRGVVLRRCEIYSEKRSERVDFRPFGWNFRSE